MIASNINDLRWIDINNNKKRLLNNNTQEPDINKTLEEWIK
jgi:hypothetical protein